MQGGVSLFDHLPDHSVLVLATDKHGRIGIENGDSRTLFGTFLLETDKLDDLLCLGSFSEDLLVLDLLGVSLLANIGIEILEEKVFIVDGLDPYLVAVAFIVVQLGIQLLLYHFLLGRCLLLHL